MIKISPCKQKQHWKNESEHENTIYILYDEKQMICSKRKKKENI